MKTVAIYARVSTDKQKVDSQLHELRKYVARADWLIYEEYIDTNFTGANTKRPAFQRMMSDAKKKKFDVLLVWKFDRLSRSLKDLITTLDDLNALGIDFVSYDNNLDTSTPTGKLVFQIVGAVAEFEKDIIRERIMSGLAVAREKGHLLGRKSLERNIPGINSKIDDLLSQGYSKRKIGRELGISEGSVRNYIKSLR